MTFLFWLLGLLLASIVLHVALSHLVLVDAERISLGRLPYELLTHSECRKARFYMKDLGTTGYGYSMWVPPFNVIVFDREFFAKAPPSVIRYVVAHEIAHFTFKHHLKKWWCRTLGLSWTPFAKRWLEGMEREADAEAVRLTGVSIRTKEKEATV